MNFDFNIADFFKLPVKIIAALTIATGGILFSPDLIAQKMYIMEFRDQHGFIIGIIFITSVSLLVMNLIVFLYKLIENTILKFKFKKVSKERLKNLNTYQKSLVCLLYNQDNFTHELPLNDGGVIFLENSLIITKATTQYLVDNMNNPMFPFVLNPWVVKELQENQELLSSFKQAIREQVSKVKPY